MIHSAFYFVSEKIHFAQICFSGIPPIIYVFYKKLETTKSKKTLVTKAFNNSEYIIYIAFIQIPTINSKHRSMLVKMLMKYRVTQLGCPGSDI